MNHFKLKFLNEAADLLAELEKSVLHMEDYMEDPEQIEQVFRIMHTFKGNSTMFDFDHVGEFTHHLETIYDLIRAGKVKMSKEILDITLASVDHIRMLLKDEDLTEKINQQEHEQLSQKLRTLAHAMEDKKPSLSTTTNGPFEASTATYYIGFLPKKDLLLKGTNPLYLIDDLAQLGNLKAYMVDGFIPEASQLDPTGCFVSWNILLATDKSPSDIKDVFMFVEDDCSLLVEMVAEKDLVANASFLGSIEVLMREQKEIDVIWLKDVASTLLLEDEKAKKSTTEHQEAKSVSGPKEAANASSIRVPSEKLDNLMNLVSELMTTQARLSLFAESQLQGELLAIAENIEKISRQLRDNTFSICLVPIESLLTRFKRLVRDLSHDLGKEVNFVTEGTETELDKTLIDRLADPLLHILRNSMDHGIEKPESRLQQGKPSTATLLFKAYYTGINVHIEIEDDGKGIDPVCVREKAVQKGLISADTVLTEKETLELIFLPGFSTASQVTEVSGRGVGMDVVRRSIAEMRGEVQLESKVGKGTKLTIKLPLTLSIIDGLLVKIHETHFVLPLSVIDKCFEVHHEMLAGNFNDLVVLDGMQVPYFYLREEFSIKENAPSIEQVVVVKHNEHRVGLVVDQIVGEYQAVLKPLGRLYKNLDIISGATILGDGAIALVLDTNQVIKQFSTPLKKKEVFS